MASGGLNGSPFAQPPIIRLSQPVFLESLTWSRRTNTIRDLLQVDIDSEGVLSDDSVFGGCDTAAKALRFASYQLAGYLEEANRALDAAFANGPRPWILNRRFDPKSEGATRRQDVYRHLDDGVAIFASDLASSVEAEPLKDIADKSDPIDRTRLLFDLAHLAIRSDSTQPITIMLQESIQLLPRPWQSLYNLQQNETALGSGSTLASQFLRGPGTGLIEQHVRTAGEGRRSVGGYSRERVSFGREKRETAAAREC